MGTRALRFGSIRRQHPLGRAALVAMCALIVTMACHGADESLGSALQATLPETPTGTIPATPPGALPLISVNGQSLSCCAIPTRYEPAKWRDATARATFAAGSLLLEPTEPTPFAGTPAGAMPADCVHVVPNGTLVDPSQFTPCTVLHNATFRLVLTYLFEYPASHDPHGGAHSAWVTDTISGEWAMSTPATGSFAMLLGTPYIGPITINSSGTDVVLDRITLGEWQIGAPVLEFFGPQH